MLYTGSGQTVHLCLRAAANQEPRQEQQPALGAARLEPEPTGNSPGEGKEEERSQRDKQLPIRDVNPFIYIFFLIFIYLYIFIALNIYLYITYFYIYILYILYFIFIYI